MKVKRFFAPTMQQALKMVREDMGADAVILSNRRVDGGVEIVTALDYNEDEERQRLGESAPASANASRLAELRADQHRQLESAMRSSRERIRSLRREAPGGGDAERRADVAAATGSPVSDRGQPSGESEAWSAMRAEIHSLRELLEQQASGRQRDTVVPISPVQQRLQERLEGMGLERELAGDLAREHGQGRLDTGWKTALKAFSQQLRTESDDLLERGGIHALVGPTGSGKTTTIGKLAARFVLRHGPEQLALITTDRYRVAGHEQLFVFGRILNVPVRVVDEENSLDDLLDELSDRRLVLIDTAGLGASDPGWQEQLNELDSRRHRINAYLVMAATSQSRVMKSTWHCYKMLNLAGTILTKLDEALTLGEVLGFSVQSNLPIAYYTDGQKIPQDIHRAGAVTLVKQAVRYYQTQERQASAMGQGA